MDRISWYVEPEIKDGTWSCHCQVNSPSLPYFSSNLATCSWALGIQTPSIGLTSSGSQLATIVTSAGES